MKQKLPTMIRKIAISIVVIGLVIISIWNNNKPNSSLQISETDSELIVISFQYGMDQAFVATAIRKSEVNNDKIIMINNGKSYPISKKSIVKLSADAKFITTDNETPIPTDINIDPEYSHLLESGNYLQLSANLSPNRRLSMNIARGNGVEDWLPTIFHNWNLRIYNHKSNSSNPTFEFRGDSNNIQKIGWSSDSSCIYYQTSKGIYKINIESKN